MWPSRPSSNIVYLKPNKRMKKKREKLYFPKEYQGKLKTISKFFIVIFLSLTLQSFVSISEQKVTLRVDNASLEQVLWKLKEQTQFEFVYSNQDIALCKDISVNASNRPLDSLLDEILSKAGLEYSVTSNVIVIRKKSEPVVIPSHSSQQKDIVVKGLVVDMDNKPLAGVTVLLKGTNNTCSTDISGRFEITVPENRQNVLIFSFIGMKTQEIMPGNRTDLVLKMEEVSEQIDEIMVVAYGTVKKEAFTGSAAIVKGEEIIRESSPLTVEKALQGYVAGVRITQTDGQPGAKATVQIRGIGSINGNIEPLYVIDGVPMVAGDKSQLISSNVMTALNPDDIESMTVLKDAAATSLYGSRAANGVIIITTKKGKSGKTVINADYEHGWVTTAMPRELFGLYMSGKEYTEYALEGLKNRYLYDRAALPGQKNYDGGNTAILEDALNYAYTNLNKRAKVIHPDDKLDGKFNYNTADYSKYLTNPRDTDWAKILFDSGREDKANISATGGNDRLRFFTSLGYYKQVGFIPSSNFGRITGKINIENKVSDRITFSIGEIVSNTDQSGTSSGGYYSNPIWGVKNLNPTAPVYISEDKYYRYPGFNTKIPNYVQNNEIQYRTSSNFRSLTNASLTIKLTDWLSFRSVNGLDFMYLVERYVAGLDSHDGRNEKGYLSELFSKITDLTTSNTLNFEKTFSEHFISALVGYESRSYNSKYFNADGTGFISDNFLYLDNAAVAASVGGSENKDRLVSYLMKADYNYKGKYYFSCSYRRDGSSRLAKDVRWGDFFALSGSWNIAREDFIKSQDWLNNLRLKLSYGTTGNLPGGFYESQSLYSLSNRYNGNPVFFLKNIGNPLLTWEHSYTWNAGIDFSLFNSRLSGSIEYYNKLTDNLLNYTSISNNTGFSSLLVNEGKLRNTGLELTLSSLNIKHNEFKWSTDLNITTMRALVEELENDVFSSPRIFRQGEHLYSFYAREWAGVNPDTGEPQWYKNTYGEDGKTPIKDGSKTSKISEANQVILCKAYPDLYGGISNRFSYKGLEFSFLATFTLGGNMFHNLDRLSADGRYIGTYNPTKEAAMDVWKKPGDKASKPMIIYDNPYQPQELSSRYLMSTNHIRIKNILLSYNLPQKWIQKLNIKNLKVYFNATDPFTFYKYDYINPEVSYTGQTNAGSRYPGIKTYRVGINVRF